MSESIFTKIINGEIPCYRIYEDAQCFAFLDINPIQPGHTLVVPKLQVASVWDLPEGDYRALMVAAQKVALRIRSVFPYKTHVGMQIEGLEIAHAHLKIFPFSTAEEYHNKPDASVAPDHAALAAVAESLAF